MVSNGDFHPNSQLQVAKIKQMIDQHIWKQNKLFTTSSSHMSLLLPFDIPFFLAKTLLNRHVFWPFRCFFDISRGCCLSNSLHILISKTYSKTKPCLAIFSKKVLVWVHKNLRPLLGWSSRRTSSGFQLEGTTAISWAPFHCFGNGSSKTNIHLWFLRNVN